MAHVTSVKARRSINSMFFSNLENLGGFLRQGRVNPGFGGEKVLAQNISLEILPAESLMLCRPESQPGCRGKSVHSPPVLLSQRGRLELSPLGLIFCCSEGSCGNALDLIMANDVFTSEHFKLMKNLENINLVVMQSPESSK